MSSAKVYCVLKKAFLCVLAEKGEKISQLNIKVQGFYEINIFSSNTMHDH